MTEVLGENWDQEEWATVKRRILQALREGQGTDYQDMLDEILLRMPGKQPPMLYVANMVTAVLIELHQLREDAKSGGFADSLQTWGLPKDVWLNAMEGLTLGLTLVERANRSVTSRLLSYCRPYHDHLDTLSAEDKTQLSDFAQEAMRIIEI